MLPQLTQLPPRDTYTVFDLGGRIARIAGPAVAAALTFTAGPSGLLLTDSATFLVSGLCLAAVGTRASNSGPVDAGQTLFTMPAKRQVRGVIGKPTLPRSSLLLLATDGIGTFASNFMWLALPILATQASRSASIYSFAIGAAAIGGLLTSLALSGRLRQMAPLHVQSAGWFAVAICVMLLAAPAHSVLILLIAFIFGAGTCGASLGFDYYAADLTQEARHELYERDQLLLRCAGTGGILVTAAALSYAPTVSLIAAGALLIGFAGRTASAAQVKTNPPVAQGTGNEGVARAF
jgi:hypothetical protein